MVVHLKHANAALAAVVGALGLQFLAYIAIGPSRILQKVLEVFVVYVDIRHHLLRKEVSEEARVVLLLVPDILLDGLVHLLLVPVLRNVPWGAKNNFYVAYQEHKRQKMGDREVDGGSVPADTCKILVSFQPFRE